LSEGYSYSNIIQKKSGGGKKDASGKEKMGCMKKDTKKFEK